MAIEGEKAEKSSASDGTRELLVSGSLIIVVGVVCMGLLMTVFGGVSVEGAHSNSGWLALILGMMCLPFGGMLLVLGVAKWLRNRGPGDK
jgi:hypothetical protein